MLDLVFGISGTGKTTHLLAEMQERAKEKQKSIYLVPEQFSSSAEMLIYKTMGDAQSGYVEVLSFRTLAERILKQSGGFTEPVLTEAGRTVFVRRVLDTLGQQAGTFARHKRNHAFCTMCADTIEELKTAGASPEVLRKIGIENKELKFTELSIVFEAYEATIAGVAMDPVDKLTRAAQKSDGGYFVGKACFIDNFDGFTAPEYTLLEEVLLKCEAISVALCCDTLVEMQNGLGLFSPVRKTALRLQQKAQKSGKRIFQKQMSKLYRTEQEDLVMLNEFLAYEESEAEIQEEKPKENSCLTLTRYASDWEEVRAVAAAMHHFAVQGVAYSRMAVVCRNITRYQSLMKRAFKLFDISYFIDAPATIEYTTPIVFLRAGLRILRDGLTSDAILALLKTGLCGFSSEQLAALENYVYAWRPKAAQWREPFENNPDGLLRRFGDVQKRQLALAEEVRAKIVPILLEFIQASRGKTAGELSKELYILLEKVHAETHAEELEQRLAVWQTQTASDEARRAWDVAVDLLEQMDLLVGKEVFSPSEYDDLFLLLVRSTDFGQLPQSLECAIFTSADRMRLANPEICFVLGVAEGEFPMQVGYSGLLSHTDRDLLVGEQVEMPGSFENRTLLEEMFFYRALTSASHQLHISWPLRYGGVPQSISAPVKNINEAFSLPAFFLSDSLQSSTPSAAFDRLGEVYRENTPQAAALYGALENDAQVEAKQWLALLEQVQNTGVFQLQKPKSVEKIVGKTLTLTATKAEQYYRCKFSYYMEQVLKVRPLRRAEISPSESGTFVHYVLEQVLKSTMQEFGKLSTEDLTILTNHYAQKFIDEKLPAISLREETLLLTIKANIVNVLTALRNSAAQSDFVPDAVELPIKEEEGAISPLRMKTPDGHEFQITGEVDRVDVLHRDGRTYLSIMDYKTGQKEFDLADVYCGINMQMMVYMDALCKNGKERYPNASPAGVLYVGVDPAPVTGERGEDQVIYKVDGLLLNDEEVLRSMDRSCSGLFLPIKYDKDGNPKTNKEGAKTYDKRLATLADIGRAEKHIEEMFTGMASGVYTGDFTARPLVKANKSPCSYCPYRAACRHEDGVNEEQVSAPKDVFRQKEEVENGGE